MREHRDVCVEDPSSGVRFRPQNLRRLPFAFDEIGGLPCFPRDDDDDDKQLELRRNPETRQYVFQRKIASARRNMGCHDDKSQNAERAKLCSVLQSSFTNWTGLLLTWVQCWYSTCFFFGGLQYPPIPFGSRQSLKMTNPSNDALSFVSDANLDKNRNEINACFLSDSFRHKRRNVWIEHNGRFASFCPFLAPPLHFHFWGIA